jgi:hypothetical protein
MIIILETLLVNTLLFFANIIDENYLIFLNTTFLNLKQILII